MYAYINTIIVEVSLPNDADNFVRSPSFWTHVKEFQNYLADILGEQNAIEI